MKLKAYITKAVNALIIALIAAALYFYGTTALFIIAYIISCLFAGFRAAQSSSYKRRVRVILVISYIAIMAVQIIFYVLIVHGGGTWRDIPVLKFFTVAALFLPAAISRYVAITRYTEIYPYTFHETGVISFSEVREFTDYIVHKAYAVRKAGRSLTPGNFKTVLQDLPRHGTFNYVNKGSLTEEYFKEAKKSFDDLNLYIIISNTGTSASQIISVFTQKQFNHASISFDNRLKTIISYNGGERVYPPGLNHELVDFFNKRKSASILIYRLPVTREQKVMAFEKISQINHEGSAYNLLGLFINKSYKPNIMYCSQFAYKILEYIGAEYFKAEGVIKPTDLIEKDYFRKLIFVEELKLSKLQ